MCAALDGGVDVNAGVDSDFGSALHLAASENRPQLVNFLVEAGADPNARDKVGWTPLLQAVFAGYLDSFRIRLAAGADNFAVDEGGNSVLHFGDSVSGSEERLKI